MSKMIRLPAILFFLCVATPAAVRAQHGSIEGIVRVAGSGEGVRDATVRILGTGLAALTDVDGRFRIARVPSGAYEVEVTRIGMTVERVGVTVRTGATATAELFLALGPVELVGIEVIGERSEALSRFAGSLGLVQPAELSARQPLTGSEVLRSVPGVHIQEEEGAGMRLNLGIRGLDPDRSRTVLMLEDGVPIALAPYGEPEMYYTPPIDRMERVEIIKGSGSILFGPQTVGGVVNYVTADAPAEPVGRLRLTGGTGSSLLGKLSYGGTWGSARATGSLLRKQADDLSGLFYAITDFTGKAGLRAGGSDLGLKLSVYDEVSNSTYVGLTDSIFRADPHTHPAPDDRLWVRRYAGVLTHEAGAAGGELRTTVYAYQTSRNWRRQDYTYSSDGNAIVFRNTAGNRNRSFEVVGVEPRWRSSWRAAGVRSEVEAGLRAHYERARDQHINGETGTSRTGEVRDDEIRTGRALAGFVQNRFFLTEALRVTPGLRVERFEYERHILRTRVRREVDGAVVRQPEDVDLRARDDLVEVIPGLGVAWSPDYRWTVFAGAHRGFAPPRVKDALIYEDPTLAPEAQVPEPVSLQLDAERSWNLELGARLHPTTYLGFEATLFHLDFSNQIIEPSLSAGSVAQAQLANQGATRHSGVEAGVAFDLGRLLRRPYELSARVNYTFVDAVFSDERLLETPSGDTVNIEGNRLPYAPRHQANAGVQFAHSSGWTLRVDWKYVGEQFSDNFETAEGSTNGRVGLVPAYRVIDLGAQYRIPLPARVTVVGSVKNLTDAVYIASRRPEGIKPGLPRLVSLGMVWEF